MGDVEHLLGIKFTKEPHPIHITQKHLIDQIIQDIHLQNTNA